MVLITCFEYIWYCLKGTCIDVAGNKYWITCFFLLQLKINDYTMCKYIRNCSLKKNMAFYLMPVCMK